MVALSIGLGVCMAVSAQRAWGQAPPPPITGVEASAIPATYTGPCPHQIRFVAKIGVGVYPMSFNYQWIRSDGAKGPIQEGKVPKATTKTMEFVDYWRLGAAGQQMTISESLRVRSGNTDITSNAAQAQITCR
jgi:hypothetical protein